MRPAPGAVLPGIPGLARITAITLIAAIALQGCADVTGGACPAIGYVYVGPVELQVPGQSPATAEVLACLGEQCAPTPVEAVDDGWALTMSTEQLDSAQPTAVTAVVLDATTGGELARGVYPITYRRTDGGGRCPGPTAPEPVVIEVPAQRS